MEHLGHKTLLFAIVMIVVYTVLFMFVDAPVDRWMHDTFYSTWVFKIGTWVSYLGDGSILRLLVALCFILVVVADPYVRKPWVKSLLYVCVSCAIALVIGEGLKYLLARHRPLMLFDSGRYGLHFLSSKWAENSTPSGHTIRAFSILTALSLLYRKYSVPFITLAVLIGVSRVVVTDHYPSDVLFGAYIGIFTALWVYRYFHARDSAAESAV